MVKLQEHRVFTLTISLILAFYLMACASKPLVNLNNPVAGTSVKINMKNGKIHEGLLLKSDKKVITLIDSETHKLANLKKNEIRELSTSPHEFDFEGKKISERDISRERGMSRTLGYGIGGFTLGGAVGFGVGILLAAGASVPFFYPMTVFSLTGGYVFGKQGFARDEEIAVDAVRSNRLKIQKAQLHKQVEESQKKLEAEKKKLKQKKQKANK